MESYEIESFWDDLLGFIEQRRVVSIIGAELLTIQHDGTTVSLPHPSARKSGAPQVIRTDLATRAVRNGLAQTDTIKHTPESGAASLAGTEMLCGS
jgi:hypothetical protein